MCRRCEARSGREGSLVAILWKPCIEKVYASLISAADQARRNVSFSGEHVCYTRLGYGQSHSCQRSARTDLPSNTCVGLACESQLSLDRARLINQSLLWQPATKRAEQRNGPRGVREMAEVCAAASCSTGVTSEQGHTCNLTKSRWSKSHLYYCRVSCSLEGFE